MGEDTRLVNIYLKIHNKQPLFLDDLRYLAKYDPECFEKTCRNVVYNIPEAEPIMEPAMRTSDERETGSMAETLPTTEKAGERDKIEEILANLRRLERAEFPASEMDAEHVKNLLASLYMEQIFPHNDKNTFMGTNPVKKPSIFDKKA